MDLHEECAHHHTAKEGDHSKLRDDILNIVVNNGEFDEERYNCVNLEILQSCTGTHVEK